MKGQTDCQEESKQHQPLKQERRHFPQKDVTKEGKSFGGRTEKDTKGETEERDNSFSAHVGNTQMAQRERMSLLRDGPWPLDITPGS